MPSTPPVLLAAIGDPRADALLAATVARFEAALPGAVRGYYLLGSFADGTGLPTSDVDLTIVLRGAPDAATRVRAADLRARCAADAPVEFDVELANEAALAAAGLDPTLKHGSLLLYGEDLRDAYPLAPLADWARDRLHSSYWRVITLFGRPLPVALPLAYPDPADEFYGYLRRPTRLPDGRAEPGTRDLIRSVGWAATALLALRAGVYVARKRDCHRLYRERIGDEWSDLIEQVSTRCRDDWRYLIPADPAARAALRALCARTLDFEDHFLAQYRAYLLAELGAAPAPFPGAPADPAHARAVLRRLPLADPAIAAALRRLPAGHERSPRPAGRAALAALAALPPDGALEAPRGVAEKTRQDPAPDGDREA